MAALSFSSSLIEAQATHDGEGRAFVTSGSTEFDDSTDRRRLQVATSWAIQNSTFTYWGGNTGGGLSAVPNLSFMCAVQSYGHAWTSTDLGRTWRKLNTTEDQRMMGDCAVSADGSKVVVVNQGSAPTAHISHDGGATFTVLGQGTQANVYKHGFVSMSDDGTYIFLFTNSNQVFRSADGGATFSSVSVHSGDIRGADCSADGKYVVIAGMDNNNGVTYAQFSSNYGVTFSDSSATFKAMGCHVLLVSHHCHHIGFIITMLFFVYAPPGIIDIVFRLLVSLMCVYCSGVSSCFSP